MGAITDARIAPAIGPRLRMLRRRLGLSLDACAERCGVSKAMLGQIERGESSPTVARLWKIASGLRVPLSYFLASTAARAAPAVHRFDPVHATRDAAGMTVDTLVPFDAALGFELFAMTLAAGALSRSAPHAPGVVEHLTVLAGRLNVQVDSQWQALRAGQTLRFSADIAHAYHNDADTPARAHDLIHYPPGTLFDTPENPV